MSCLRKDLLYHWAIAAFLCSAMSAALQAVSCPPKAGDGAVRVRDLDGDNVKDFRFDAAAGENKRTEVDEAGNRKELWCVDHGQGSFFVWMYTAAAGEPCADPPKFIGFCEFEGGGNVRTEEKALIGGKQRWSKTKHVNSDRFNKNAKVSKRIYDFDPRACTLTQSSVKRSNGQTVVDKNAAAPPQETGRAISLPPFPGPDPPSPPENTFTLIPANMDPPQPDTNTCDTQGRGVIDITDIMNILNARGKSAVDNDPRDADADGIITVNDARICSQMCTNALCAK